MEGGSDGNGGAKGSRNNNGVDTNTLVGSGGAGYVTDGESVCGANTSGSGATQDCDETNVIAQGDHANLNGNKGGFVKVVDDEDAGASGGAGGFGGGGQGKQILMACCFSSSSSY